MLAGEFSSRWIWYKIPYMCIIARASTNRMILFAFRFDCSRRLRYVIGGFASKAEILGLEESELADLIYAKWQVIVDHIWEEYKQTEE